MFSFCWSVICFSLVYLGKVGRFHGRLEFLVVIVLVAKHRLPQFVWFHAEIKKHVLVPRVQRIIHAREHFCLDPNRVRQFSGGGLQRHLQDFCFKVAAADGFHHRSGKRQGAQGHQRDLPDIKAGSQFRADFRVLGIPSGIVHDGVEMESLIAPIVQVCDAISGARPGARREVAEAYIQRLNKLEELALTYPGVVKTYAIQAGRELRVIVGAEKVSDNDVNQISYDLSRKIQDEMTYPGQIKITVIRETRAINYAK